MPTKIQNSVAIRTLQNDIMKFLLSLAFSSVSFNLVSAALMCASDEIAFEFQFRTDNYGYESSWTLTEDYNNPVPLYGIPTNCMIDDQTYDTSACIPKSCYTLTILDSYGDGIRCGGTNAGYILTVDNVELQNYVNVAGYNFGFSVTFGTGTDCSSTSPSVSPVDSTSPSVSQSPTAGLGCPTETPSASPSLSPSVSQFPSESASPSLSPSVSQFPSATPSLSQFPTRPPAPAPRYVRPTRVPSAAPIMVRVAAPIMVPVAAPVAGVTATKGPKATKKDKSPSAFKGSKLTASNAAKRHLQ